MKKILRISFLVIIIFYLGICGYYYFNQEKMIFAPIALSENYVFKFENPFEEVILTAPDNIKLHALHFKTENPKGVIYYLHGKSGNLDAWGAKAKTFTNVGYDVFLLDYRGFGKSEGEINSEEEFYADVQLGYDYLTKNYSEDEISVLGFSLGSTAATKLAMDNHPKELILLAPYFNLNEKFKKDKFYMPKFLCKYKFPLDEFISKVSSPIRIFYGDSDIIIDQKEVNALQSKLKPEDEILILKIQGHNEIENHEDFLVNFRTIKLEYDFHNFHTAIYQGELADLDFFQNLFKSDSNFVQFIQKEIQKKPINFAGKYTIIEKSCGIECSHVFVVNRQSGKVYDSISINDESCGFLYQADSNLLIRNANSLIIGNLKDYEGLNCLPIYYVWKEKDFMELERIE
jgi:esterase/lipase